VALSLAVTSCGPKLALLGASDPPKKTKLEALPADAVLWQGDPVTPFDASATLVKEGVLVRTREPEETARYWPFSMDYWGISRTDLEPLLAPHVGRTIRVEGHFKKTYDEATWIYEVDPVKITALAGDPAEAGANGGPK
jgi:hypothetical protein